MAELKFEAGDEVRLRLSDRELDGKIVESEDSSLVLLKLKSGYNIGIPKENVLGSTVVKKFKAIERSYSLPHNPQLPSVGLIVTGGTIASKADMRTGGVKPIGEVGELATMYPELFTMVNVVALERPFMVLSESMNSEHWRHLAESVKKMLDKAEVQGVIITHGTDTLGYTGGALSFFLRNLNKPVVLTYSQKSIDRASSDAHLNLACAARMAVSAAAEVMLVGHASIHDDYCYALRATKIKKMHSSRRDAFKPVNCEALANVWPDKVAFLSSYTPRQEGKVELDNAYSDKVALVKFYPGQDASILDYYALTYKGIVIEGTGMGHVATLEGSSWISALKKHIRNGLVVCMTTQTVYGKVDPYVYSTGRELVDAGVIFLEDMLAETALVKLGWVLGHYGWKGKVKEKMLENVAGELNHRLSL